MILTSSFVALIYSLSTSYWVIESSGQIGILSPLHVEGRYIKDAFNRTIYLRGVDWQGYSEDTRGLWPTWGDTTNLGRQGVWSDDRVRSTYQVLRDDWGVNCMRWHLIGEWWLNNLNNYRYYIRRGIELAQEYGIYIILDMARLANDWTRIPMPFYPYDTHLINGEYFYEQDFIDWWMSVATELGDLPNWLIDPFNEPAKKPGATEQEWYADRAVWFDVVYRLYDAVRRSPDDHIILLQWMEGVWYGWDCAMRYWLDDFIAYFEDRNATKNIAISNHNYHDNFVYWGGRPNTLEQLLADYTVAGLTRGATEINYPLIIGEVGALLDVLTGAEWEQEKIWFNNTLTLYNQWGTSYIAWVWAKQGTGRAYALLQSGTWFPPPSESGRILIEAIKKGGA